MKRFALAAVVALTASMPVAAGAACTPGEDGCMPEASDCATGAYNGVTLGRHYGAAAICVGGAESVVVYAGGNPALPCGSIVVLDETIVPGEANACDDFQPGDNSVRFQITLPAGYDATDERYPVLYLLPGGGGDETTWGSITDLSAYADLGVIVVSPFNGLGMYNDWRDGRYQMESVIVDGLIPHIDATYRTLDERAHRFIAGFSQGGYGAMFLSARHPELFAAAASFSGVLDIRDPEWAAIASFGYQTVLSRYGEPPATDMPIFGNYVTDEVWWRGRNPLDLVRNLRGIDLSVYTGNGFPGEYDDFFSVALGGESGLYRQAEAFTAALEAEGIEHVYEVHDGGHLYQYAADILTTWLPRVLGETFTPPATFDHRTVDLVAEAYGWTVAADHARATEFLEIAGAGADGVTVSGSGLTTIITAPLFAPGEVVPLDGAVAEEATADADGRITFAVDLGPPHERQQYSLAERVSGQSPTTVVVTFG